MSHIHLYMNNPTADAVDGTEISGGDETLPLSFTLDTSKSETGIAKCAVRCDSGYLIDGGARIYFDGSDTSNWQAANDENFTDSDTALIMANWQNEITVSEVAATNKVFWVKVLTGSAESPQNDRSVDLKAEGLVVAAEG